MMYICINIISYDAVGIHEDQAAKKHLSCAAMGGPGGAHRLHQNVQRYIPNVCTVCMILYIYCPYIWS